MVGTPHGWRKIEHARKMDDFLGHPFFRKPPFTEFDKNTINRSRCFKGLVCSTVHQMLLDLSVRSEVSCRFLIRKTMECSHKIQGFTILTIASWKSRIDSTQKYASTVRTTTVSYPAQQPNASRAQNPSRIHFAAFLGVPVPAPDFHRFPEGQSHPSVPYFCVFLSVSLSFSLFLSLQSNLTQSTLLYLISLCNIYIYIYTWIFNRSFFSGHFG